MLTPWLPLQSVSTYESSLVDSGLGVFDPSASYNSSRLSLGSRSSKGRGSMEASWVLCLYLLSYLTETRSFYNVTQVAPRFTLESRFVSNSRCWIGNPSTSAYRVRDCRLNYFAWEAMIDYPVQWSRHNLYICPTLVKDNSFKSICDIFSRLETTQMLIIGKINAKHQHIDNIMENYVSMQISYNECMISYNNMVKHKHNIQ